MIEKAKKDPEIEKVYKVFEDYIRESPYLEWFWSEKLGYVLMQISMRGKTIETNEVITDAEELCGMLFHEIASDVLEMTGNEHDPNEADPLERKEIERRLETYMERLPEYSHLWQKLFEK